MDTLDVSLTRGTIDLLILKALTWGPRHGYAVAEWIETATNETMLIGEGTLYPSSTASRKRATSKPRGACRKTTVKPSSTASAPPAASD